MPEHHKQQASIREPRKSIRALLEELVAWTIQLHPQTASESSLILLSTSLASSLMDRGAIQACRLHREPQTEPTESRPSLAQGFKKEVSDQGGHNGYQKVRAGKNIVQGERQSPSSSVGSVEFTHQEIRIEEQDDERNLDDRPQDRG